jgi:hypothetical protein
MRSTGIVLVIAMSLAFIYSVILHPALMILVRERLGWSIDGEPSMDRTRKNKKVLKK